MRSVPLCRQQRRAPLCLLVCCVFCNSAPCVIHCQTTRGEASIVTAVISFHRCPHWFGLDLLFDFFSWRPLLCVFSTPPFRLLHEQESTWFLMVRSKSGLDGKTHTSKVCLFTGVCLWFDALSDQIRFFVKRED